MMGINQFIYNGKRSYDDMCLIITETPPFVTAERDITFEKIPGKSGNLLKDNGRYENITMPYDVAILPDQFELPVLVKKIAAWLGSPGGYFILSDTYDPQYFRYAKYAGKLDIADILLKIGTAKLNFNCKPFKYSFEGQCPVEMTEAGTLYNAELFPSAPYIKICGSGTVTLTVNEDIFLLSDIDEYIELDSETMNAYKGTQLKNNKMTSLGFPVFKPGNNSISWDGNVERLEIVPRWCCL